MDFFQHQDVARRNTSLLIAYYALAVVLIVAGVYFATAATFVGWKAKSTAEAVEWSRLWNPQLVFWVTLATLAIVAGGTVFKVSQLAQGGQVVARMLGGRPVNPNTRDADERRLLNVVEEMAIASGTPVPRVFVLEREDGINAFAAGFTATDAVVAVTRGTLRTLSRDELQGVIAHEFSHILNGDMRLNIRLLGVLNGILVIGMAGYWIMRSTLFSSGRSRSRQKGNTLPIVLFGLVVMVIGFVGVLFGKLIKSAVSRQREYLADASAVQYTRNPSGIASALKKIGGYVRGSRIRNERAEEVSHFFFANGLAGGLSSLFATHPPLEERIRRLDPAFRGRVTEAAAPPAIPEPGAQAGGYAEGRASRFAVDPAKVISSVGAPQSDHLDYAGTLRAGLPEAAVEAAREPFGARAVVYGLLLDRKGAVREAQLQALEAGADSAVYQETVRLLPRLEAVGPAARLPLLDLAIPALKELSDAQYESFRENVRGLVTADRQIDLFEYALQRTIVRHVEPQFRRIRRVPVRHRSVEPLLQPCGELLSCLAYWGTEEPEAARAAFRKGAQRLAVNGRLSMRPADVCGLQMVDRSLDLLAAAAPAVKKTVLDACVTCIAADGFVTTEEAELIRAVADSLDCPMPPFLPGRLT